MTSSTCPRCRRGVPAGAAFCTSCGASLGDEVEIELEDARPDASADDDPAVAWHRRHGRRVGAGVMVTLVAVIAASIASGGDERTVPTSTTAAPTTAATTAPASATAASTAAPASTTGPGPTTTTTIQVVATGLPLLREETGASLLLTSSRGLLRLELDTGRAVPVNPGGIPSFVEDLVAVRGGFVGWSQGITRVYRFDERPDAIEPPNGQLLGGDADGRAWLLVHGSDGTISLAVVADARSPVELVAAPWTPDAYPQLRPDGIGGVLQSAAGGVYRWEPGGQPVAVAAGTVVDAAHGFVLTRLCYPDPACRLTVTDLRSVVPPRALPDLPRGPTRSLRVSPDGRWIVDGLDSASDPPTFDDPLVLHEVATGRTVALPVDDGNYLRNNSWMTSRLAWTADDRWLFYVGGARTLMAWHDGLTEPVRIQLPTETLSGGVAVEVPA